MLRKMRRSRKAFWSCCACAQALNNFTAFYVSHQIFFLVFVLLFMLHPVPKYSHVRGKRQFLPIPYSWVRSFSSSK